MAAVIISQLVLREYEFIYRLYSFICSSISYFSYLQREGVSGSGMDQDSAEGSSGLQTVKCEVGLLN